MDKYVCSICGYIYDEALGIPEAGIEAGTLWNQVPSDWVCPLCGASKAEFNKQGGTGETTKLVGNIEIPDDVKEMSPMEISALCSNLARGCEKQYKPEEAELFTQLAQYYKAKSAPAKESDFAKLKESVAKDLEETFPAVHAVATRDKDRGALRALVWSEKVTRILNSILIRYEKEKETMIEDADVYVCTICGFVYIGDHLPEVCPICKVPNWKFEKVGGGN